MNEGKKVTELLAEQHLGAIEVEGDFEKLHTEMIPDYTAMELGAQIPHLINTFLEVYRADPKVGQ